jgi:hypothetical protein
MDGPRRQSRVPRPSAPLAFGSRSVPKGDPASFGGELPG